MFTVSPVYIRDHDPRCSVAGTEPTARHIGGSYKMPFMRWYQEGGSQRPPWSPGVPQVESEDLVANIPNTFVNMNIY